MFFVRLLIASILCSTSCLRGIAIGAATRETSKEGPDCIVQIQNDKRLRVYVIPGQNDLGTDIGYLQSVLGSAAGIERVAPPAWWPWIDMGQRWCMALLRQAIKKGQASDYHEIFLYSNSQGTATAFNYIAQAPVGHVRGGVFEACMASGNSAIHHTVKGPLMNMSFLARIPFSYYLLPYLAKVIFPLYSPGGLQAIKAVEKIKDQGPFIIVHSEGDPQLSLEDSYALYHVLKRNGNSVYFIKQTGRRHINVLKEKNKKIVRAILAREKIYLGSRHEPLSDEEARKYQPDHMNEPYAGAYERLKSKETWHTLIKYSFMLCTAAVIAVKVACA